MSSMLILVHNEYGIDCKNSAGWQLKVNKYLFLAVGFLYKSVTILPSFISHDTSKYGIEDTGRQGQKGNS